MANYHFTSEPHGYESFDIEPRDDCAYIEAISYGYHGDKEVFLKMKKEELLKLAIWINEQWPA